MASLAQLMRTPYSPTPHVPSPGRRPVDKRADAKTIAAREAMAADEVHVAAGLLVGMTLDEARATQPMYWPSKT